MEAKELLEKEGVDIPLWHSANSPATLLRPDTYLDGVRVGDAIFGLCPISEDIWEEQELSEVMTWESYVSMVKEVPSGTPVGYDCTFVTSRDTTIATIPVGFADGLSRGLSNKGWSVVAGQRAPIIGRVCMDQYMLDVTDIPEVKVGDSVTLIGEGSTILEMANLLDKNVDEIVCGIADRVPRIYKD